MVGFPVKPDEKPEQGQRSAAEQRLTGTLGRTYGNAAAGYGYGAAVLTLVFLL